ncbi:MAG TPA: TetR/AcrR family transcriptional regulator [Mycobacteriales bacterium]|nr:TetR/AcrR family transcriptional regulator [Mycobacteriales bacterium]
MTTDEAAPRGTAPARAAAAVGADRADAAVPVRTTRGERTRAKLLDAARVAFRGVPWNRARVEDVCRAAGVGHGTYYAYFANKEAVLEALVRRHADALYRLAEEPWTSGHVEEDVRRVIGGFVALSEEDRDIREVWFAAAPSEPALHDLVSEVRRQFVARVRAALSAAVEAGVARRDLDVEVAATALAAMVEQTVTLAQRGEGTPGERLVDGLTDLWVHAVYR